MTSASSWDLTTQRSIEALCQRRGRDAVIADCLDLAAGAHRDAALIVALAGPGAVRFADGPRPDDYWLRVWALRGLLWAGIGAPDSGSDQVVRARETVIAGLSDEAWRVREMAAKVIARYEIDEALGELLNRRDDPVPRVRVAADRAIAVLTRAGTAPSP